MTPAARISAALEVLDDISGRRRPASDALKDWGLAHRFAGSGDRAGIAGLVFDALRRRASSACMMGSESSRAIMLGALRRTRGLTVADIEALCNGERHAPPPLHPDEHARLTAASLEGAPLHVAGDFPEWLAPAFAESFGDDAVAEGQALADRAPVDLRVNTLKSSRDKALDELSHLSPQPTPYSPVGVRILPKADGRGPALTAEPAYIKGLVEVQDEGSQLSALLSGAAPGQQVLDLCAGAGGKSLALAAMLDNQGQIYATDSDGRRLAPLFDRLERSGARNVQVRAPRGAEDVLGDLLGHMDLVFVDAPCTGSGAWRRNPDAKWRIRPGALEQRLERPGSGARRSGALCEARRPARLCHLFGAEGRERGASRRLPRPPSAISCRSTRSRWRSAPGCPKWLSARQNSAPACASARMRPAPTAFMSRVWYAQADFRRSPAYVTGLKTRASAARGPS